MVGIRKDKSQRIAILFDFCRFVLLSFPTVCAAGLNPSIPLHQFILQNWQAEQGLPQNSVLSIAQTADGYLWLGTEEGLARFDGVRFVNFDSANSPLRSNLVRSLLVDRQGTLWIGTGSGGLSQYRQGKLTSFAAPADLQSLSVSVLCESRTGAIWVGTDGSGLLQVMPGGVIRRFGPEDGLADNVIVAVHEKDDGSLWILTQKGLNVYAGGHFSQPDTPDGLARSDLRSFLFDQTGAMWAGTATGLYRIASGTVRHYTTKDGLSGNEISALAEDSAGSIWIGTSGKGLTRYAEGKFASANNEAPLANSDIGSLFEDKQGTLWMGTGGRGLLSLRQGAFNTLTTKDGLAADTILPVFHDRQGRMWIGSEHGLMRRTDASTRLFTVKDGLPDDLVLSITQGSDNGIWAGTRRGLAHIEADKVTTTLTEKSGLPSGFIVATYTDDTGNLWIGTRRGLTRFDGKVIKTYTVADGLPDDFVHCITEDRSGALWVGTSAGLSTFREGHFDNFGAEAGLSSLGILGFYRDKEDVLWVATMKGLNRFSKGRAVAFGRESGLFDGAISAVVEDRFHFLWMTSNRGIFKVAKAQLNAYAAGSRAPMYPVSYDVSDGLRSRECNGGFQPAASVGPDGRLYFPTALGLAYTQPRDQPPRIGGQLLLERLTVNNRSVRVDSPATIPPGAGKLEFQFTQPDLHLQNKLQFRYMLEGFDKDWVYSEARRTAFYTNIPHGEYHFLAQAGTSGQWTSNYRSPTLTLQPHFYQTRIFLVLVGLAIFGAYGGVYRIRMNQAAVRERKLKVLVDQRTAALRESESKLRQSRDELELRVQDRTKELTAANCHLEEEIATRRQTEELLLLAKEAAEAANRAKSDFLTNMSHELRTPINGILGMTELTLTTELDAEQSEYLEIAKSSANSLLGIVNDILDFSKIETRKLEVEYSGFQLRQVVQDAFGSLSARASQKGLSYYLNIEPTIPDQLVSDSSRIRQVLINLLDNALKFTSHGAVTLAVVLDSIRSESAVLHFIVTDTGIGIAEDKRKAIFEAFSQADTSSTRRYGGTGLGLTISFQLASMLGGSLWVESQPGLGSAFHFTVKADIITQDNEPSLQPIGLHH